MFFAAPLHMTDPVGHSYIQYLLVFTEVDGAGVGVNMYPVFDDTYLHNYVCIYRGSSQSSPSLFFSITSFAKIEKTKLLPLESRQK